MVSREMTAEDTGALGFAEIAPSLSSLSASSDTFSLAGHVKGFHLSQSASPQVLPPPARQSQQLAGPAAVQGHATDVAAPAGSSPVWAVQSVQTA